MREAPLTPAQHAKIRRLSAPAEAQPGDEAGELNVVPYLDIIMNIMMFVLVSVSVAFASTINTSAAQAQPRPGPTPRGLHLTALITGEGVALKTSGAAVAPGCQGTGGGITVPNRDGRVDLAELAACARRIKTSNADAADERQVTVTASPGVPYEALIGVMDGLRADAQGELFPEVTLGAIR